MSEELIVLKEFIRQEFGELEILPQNIITITQDLKLFLSKIISATSFEAFNNARKDKHRHHHHKIAAEPSSSHHKQPAFPEIIKSTTYSGGCSTISNGYRAKLMIDVFQMNQRWTHIMTKMTLNWIILMKMVVVEVIAILNVSKLIYLIPSSICDTVFD